MLSFAPRWARVTGSCALVAAVAACDDDPGPPTGPGNVVIDDTMQDAVAQLTQDSAAPPPQGIGDAGDGAAYFDGAMGASTGYVDANSPLMACSSCTCDQRVAFCLENGASRTVTGEAGAHDDCPLAKQTELAVGCNVLPAACAKTPTCECVLDNVQPPLPCYPECTTSSGYIDVFCAVP